MSLHIYLCDKLLSEKGSERKERQRVGERGRGEGEGERMGTVCPDNSLSLTFRGQFYMFLNLQLCFLASPLHYSISLHLADSELRGLANNRDPLKAGGLFSAL
jgi:hypothetical protein